MRNLERFWQSSLLSKNPNALFPPKPSIILFALSYLQNDVNVAFRGLSIGHLVISLFGLSDDNMEKAKELQVVEQTLMPHLEGVL